jgi:hypothetical protein
MAPSRLFGHIHKDICHKPVDRLLIKLAEDESNVRDNDHDRSHGAVTNYYKAKLYPY